MPATLTCPRGAADVLDAMHDRYALSARWAHARFAWAKRLLPAQKGRIGEKLLAAYAEQGGVGVSHRTDPGHDVRLDDVAVEVKFSTEYDCADPADVGYKWLQLRPDDDYDVVALIGVEPDQVHVWLVDKSTALRHAHGQHGGKAATETKSVEVLSADLPGWLGPDVADDPAAFAGRLEELTR